MVAALMPISFNLPICDLSCAHQKKVTGGVAIDKIVREQM